MHLIVLVICLTLAFTSIVSSEIMQTSTVTIGRIPHNEEWLEMRSDKNFRAFASASGGIRSEWNVDGIRSWKLIDDYNKTITYIMGLPDKEKAEKWSVFSHLPALFPYSRMKKEDGDILLQHLNPDIVTAFVPLDLITGHQKTGSSNDFSFFHNGKEVLSITRRSLSEFTVTGTDSKDDFTTFIMFYELHGKHTGKK